MVDDFWGEYQWDIFVDSMQRVFPDKRIEELGEDHELLHVLYDLDQRTQIPGRGGQRPETPHWRGIFDDDGRYGQRRARVRRPAGPAARYCEVVGLPAPFDCARDRSGDDA